MAKDPNWRAVKQQDPCEICGHDDWCRRSLDGCHECHRIAIDVPGFNLLSTTRSGFGLYRPLDVMHEPHYRQRIAVTPKKEEAPPRDWGALAMDCVHRFNGDAARAFAQTLGVTFDALRSLNAGVTTNGTWTFPMRDALRRCVGIRTRTPDGQKRAIKGSREGVFIPMDRRQLDPLVICEGPTDTAAFLDLGFYAIGRPSNLGGVEPLTELAKGFDVVICYDNDRPGSTADTNTKRGAEQLARELRDKATRVRAIHPVFAKDARDWVREGVTREKVLEVIHDARQL